MSSQQLIQKQIKKVSTEKTEIEKKKIRDTSAICCMRKVLFKSVYANGVRVRTAMSHTSTVHAFPKFIALQKNKNINQIYSRWIFQVHALRVKYSLPRIE